MDVKVISFADPQRLDAYERSFGRGLRCYADPERAAYAAFGFRRGSIARVWLNPKVWASSALLAARGRRPRSVGEDTLQLGGDVLVDAAGRIRWVRPSEGPEDRPGVQELIEAVTRDLPTDTNHP